MNFEKLISSSDTGSIKKAKKLATINAWRNLEANEKFVWGECKSIGALYYKVSLDFQNSSYKCNCPSRKFPCKHALALIIFSQENPTIFRFVEYLPSWVADWVENRKIPPKGKSAEEKEAELKKKIEIKDKKITERIELMQTGIIELELWLSDVIRQGLATIQNQQDEFWTKTSSALVDAKLGGIAKRIRLLREIFSYKDWHEKLLLELSEIYLMVKGFNNLDKLPPDLQRELLYIAGMNFKKADVLKLKPVNDSWAILGQTSGVEEKVKFRKTWLQGLNTGKNALILDFAWGNLDFEREWQVGEVFKGSLVYYPSPFPLRVTVKILEKSDEKITAFTGYKHIKDFADNLTKVFAKNPWIISFPVILKNVIPVFEKETFILVDINGKKISRIEEKKNKMWNLIAMSGGKHIDVFGVWEKGLLKILSCVADSRFVFLGEYGYNIFRLT